METFKERRLWGVVKNLENMSKNVLLRMKEKDWGEEDEGEEDEEYEE